MEVKIIGIRMKLNLKYRIGYKICTKMVMANRFPAKNGDNQKALSTS
jgi:hypothetical protein